AFWGILGGGDEADQLVGWDRSAPTARVAFLISFQDRGSARPEGIGWQATDIRVGAPVGEGDGGGAMTVGRPRRPPFPRLGRHPSLEIVSGHVGEARPSAVSGEAAQGTSGVVPVHPGCPTTRLS